MAHTLSRLKCRTFLFAALASLALLPAVTPAEAQEGCALTLTVNQVPVEQLTLADFDLQHFESRGLIFTVNIANPGPDPVDSVRLDIVLKIELTDDHSFLPAAVMRSNAFTVPVGGRTVTNLNLGQSKEIGLETFEIIPEAREEIEKRALSTGIFPAGVYTFDISLTGCPAPPVEVVLRLGNPSRLELVAPRDGEDVSQYPVFEFFHEGRSARLVVAELRPGQTYEDAIVRNPAMLERDLTTERTVVYSGGRLLEAGRSYVWRIQTLTTIPGGTTVDLSSPVWSFTVAEGGTFEDALLARLERLYGAQYPEVFQAIRQGAFSPTGSYLLDAKGLSAQELAKILDELEQALESSELTFE